MWGWLVDRTEGLATRQSPFWGDIDGYRLFGWSVDK